MSYPKDPIYNVLQPALNCRVIWRDVNAPRPTKPYCTLAFGRHNPMDFPSLGPLSSSGTRDVIKGVTSVVEIAYYGDEAYMRLLDASTRLGFTRARDGCVLGNISIGQLISLNNVPMAVDKSQFEERAVMEVEFNWVSVLTDDPGLIEQVVIVGGTITEGADPDAPRPLCAGVVTSP